MYASEARKISGRSSGSVYKSIYEEIKSAAKRGKNSVIVRPCQEWCEFYEHFTRLGYEVSQFYYHWEEELYAEIVW